MGCKEAQDNAHIITCVKPDQNINILKYEDLLNGSLTWRSKHSKYSKNRRWEPSIKYIEQNSISYFLAIQLTEKYLLAIITLNDCYEVTILSRSLEFLEKG